MFQTVKGTYQKSSIPQSSIYVSDFLQLQKTEKRSHMIDVIRLITFSEDTGLQNAWDSTKIGQTCCYGRGIT